jgi:hypothetical protein
LHAGHAPDYRPRLRPLGENARANEAGQGAMSPLLATWANASMRRKGGMVLPG